MKASHFLLSCAAIFALVFLVFGKSIFYGFVPHDDPAYVVENGYINEGLSPEGIRWAFLQQDGGKELLHEGVANLWHPLTWLSHMTDVSLFGLDSPSGHHFVNLLLHAIAAVLMMLVILQVSQSWKTALAIALLWAIHPLKVESAAWISERKDVLSGAFAWGAIFYALKARTAPTPSCSLIGWLLFLAALMSKPAIVILPGLLILLQGLITKEGRWDRAFWLSEGRHYRWWFVTAAAIAGLTIVLQSSGSHAYFLEQSSLTGRLYHQGAGLGFYLLRFLIPWGLTIDYAIPSFPPIVFIACWAAVIAGLTYTWAKRSSHPRLFFAVAWWCLCLLPVSGLVYVGSSFTSDRYLYLAIAGPILIAALTLKERLSTSGQLAILTLTITAWGLLSWKQTQTWKDGQALYTHLSITQPQNSKGWTNLGSVYKAAGQPALARTHYQKALSLSPHDYITHHNLAEIEQMQGDLPSAQRSYQAALSGYPHHLPSLRRLAQLALNAKDYPNAADYSRRACEVTKFRNPDLLFLLLQTQLVQNKVPEGRDLLQKMAQIPAERRAHLASKIQQAAQFIQLKEKQTQAPSS